MNINRDNYELFFLLYVDNELSAEERLAVENFVAVNTDLKAELQLLMQTSLPAEEIIFVAKKELYKNEMSHELLMENLLSHLDRELEPGLVKSLEAEIKDNASLKNEWNMLQQTKLDPADKIIFENKNLLYRKEKDNIIFIRFRRIAVAAAIVGLGLFIGISLFTPNKKENDIAVTQKNKPGKNIPALPKLTDSVIKNNKMPEYNVSENIAAVAPAITSMPVRKNTVSIPEHQNNPVARKEDLTKTTLENINEQKSNKTVSHDVQENKKIFQDKKENEIAQVENKNPIPLDVKEPLIPENYNTLTETPASYAKLAALDKPASEENDNHILFLNEEKINRSKISGLFRKVKRVVARNTNIKTGGSFKIAGFEVAAK